MRLAARRRAQWKNRPEVVSDRQGLVMTKGGAVEVIRLGEGEPVVMVAGLAGGWRLLAPLAARLARRHEVILYSQRGDRMPVLGPRPHSLSDYADDLADLIGQLGLERPSVFGVSFGGAVALQLAVEHPERLGALIVQGAEARFRSSIGSSIARRVLERFPLPSDNRFVNQFFNILHGGKPAPGPLANFVVERCWETDQSVMAQRLELLESFDVSDRLWHIDVPALVLAGTRDVIVPAGRQQALASAIAGARFASLEGAGHIAFLTHGADVARHATRLIRDSRRSLC